MSDSKAVKPTVPARVLSASDIEAHQKLDATKPKTADVLHRFKDSVRYSKDGKKYRIKLTNRKDQLAFREMLRPHTKLQQQRGLELNHTERKVQVRKPGGGSAYVFESMLETVERKGAVKPKYIKGQQSVLENTDTPGRVLRRLYNHRGTLLKTELLDTTVVPAVVLEVR